MKKLQCLNFLLSQKLFQTFSNAINPDQKKYTASNAEQMFQNQITRVTLETWLRTRKPARKCEEAFQLNFLCRQPRTSNNFYYNGAKKNYLLFTLFNVIKTKCDVQVLKSRNIWKKFYAIFVIQIKKIYSRLV